MLFDASGKEIGTKPKQFILRYNAVAFFEGVALDYSKFQESGAIYNPQLLEQGATGVVQLPAPENDPRIGDEEAITYASKMLNTHLTQQAPAHAHAILCFALLLERDANDEYQPAALHRPVGAFSFYGEMKQEARSLVMRLPPQLVTTAGGWNI